MTILIVGKMNELMKNLNDFLKYHFRVHMSSDITENALGMIKVVNPSLILINFVGIYDMDLTLFERIHREHANIPVITIGSASDANRISKYYESGQFVNIERPVENSTILDTICKRLAIVAPEPYEEEKVDTRAKVLVVDDNVQTLRVLKGILDDKYKVTLANSGMKAMTSIGKDRPDLILLDYEMPICDGRQTLEMIRADEEIKDIPVIFLTGVNDKEHIQAVLNLKPARYLLKPPNSKVLIETIDGVLAEI
ncbi:MAG: response regulator [Lachnospiraceae bacterium]|nr:response regulator [Lachnospiraceae bacterium]